MIELGVLKLAGSTSILNARSKVRQLGTELLLDPIAATRLAVATSQTARRLTASSAHPRIRIELVADAGARALHLVFEGWQTEPDETPLQPFFDVVTGSHSDGEFAIRASVQLRDQSLHLDQAFLTTQRERLRQRSRNELMQDIAEQNRELERHRNQLEEIVIERTAELEKATKAAHQANKAKSQFLSNMSHELRTPLNGVLGYTQVLQRDPDFTSDQRESLAAIESCGRHLLTLINDVLDLSKIEAGQLELDYAPCDIRRLIRNVFDIVRPRAESNGLEFTTDVADDLPNGISTDPTKLKQVLVNLLGNSVKFTSKGSVGLRVSANDGRLAFEVTDTGIGMTPQEAASIFDPFKQAEGGKTSGGTGLGLSISKRIVEALGGSMTVESEKGEGSRFLIDVPLVEADIDGSAGHEQDSLSGDRDVVLAPGQEITLLVADDNEANRDILVRLLHGAGFKTVQAVDGQDAVEKLRVHDIPLALMDVRMPRMTGAEATAIIREDDRLRSTKVVAVTASVFPDFWTEMGDVGFDDFVPKPIRATDIFNAIEKLLDVTLIDAGAGNDGDAGFDIDAEFDITGVDPVRAGAIAEKLSATVDMGDIDAVGLLAEECEPGEPGLATELARLARAFDLMGLEALATELHHRSESA